MSFEAVNWAFKQPITNSGAKFVLVALSNYANEHGATWPSQKRLKELTGISERAIREHLVFLENLGLITRTSRKTGEGKYTSDEFQLNLQRQISPQADSANGKKCKNQRQISSKPAADSATYTNIEPLNTNQSITPPISPPSKKRAEIPEWLNAKDWSDFVDHRKTIRAPLSKEAAKRAIAELERLKGQGFDPATVINQTIINGWRGLFAPKDIQPRGNTPPGNKRNGSGLTNNGGNRHAGFNERNYREGATPIDEIEWAR